VAATSQPLATQVAIDILKQGGSAIDAAIAANATLGLMEPTGSGIGGDLFAIVWDAGTSQLYGLNASGRSPRGLTLSHFESEGLKKVPPYGPLPITVPGCVDGWFELHAKFGRLPMDKVLAPAIRYAREGFPVSELIAHYWALGGEVRKGYPNFASTYLPNGRAPRHGEIFKNPDLASTYAALARGGREAFYRGELAHKMDTFFRKTGCFLRAEDLAMHRSAWVRPLSTSYRGFDVWELPPNGQGIAVLQMLNLLEAHDLKAYGHNSGPTLHLMIEAKKVVFEDRARYYADPFVNELPIDALISKPYADQRRKLIRPDRVILQADPGDARLTSGDTIYLTVADRDRNMVSLIQSNYRGFGSGLVPDGLGFCLQDRGELFTFEAGHPNVYAPGKLPFHTIIPAFVTREGKPFLSFGVMGGDMQPQGHVQVVCNIIDFGMGVQEAGDSPRWYHAESSTPTGERMTDGGRIGLESGISQESASHLRTVGHRFGDFKGIYGGYQAIMYDAVNDVYRAASESRKDGHAAGY
jgi:gamma-glutamyltranspeptidase/glutathione hydrolase